MGLVQSFLSKRKCPCTHGPVHNPTVLVYTLLPVWMKALQGVDMENKKVWCVAKKINFAKLDQLNGCITGFCYKH